MHRTLISGKPGAVMRVATVVTVMLVLGQSGLVRAEDTSSVDVYAYENLDVVETKSGSVYKGVIVDQDADKIVIVLAGGIVREVKTDDVAALSKEPNPGYRHATPTTSGGSTSDAPIIAGSAPGGESENLPPPLARSGVQIQPELAILFPTGDIDDDATSFGPTIRFGYEAVYGHLGLGGGIHLRYATWDIPTEFDHHTTTEAHLYGRAGMHIGRTVLYAGVSIGVDVNHVYNNYVEVVVSGRLRRDGERLRSQLPGRRRDRRQQEDRTALRVRLPPAHRHDCREPGHERRVLRSLARREHSALISRRLPSPKQSGSRSR